MMPEEEREWVPLELEEYPQYVDYWLALQRWYNLDILASQEAGDEETSTFLRQERDSVLGKTMNLIKQGYPLSPIFPKYKEVWQPFATWREKEAEKMPTREEAMRAGGQLIAPGVLQYQNEFYDPNTMTPLSPPIVQRMLEEYYDKAGPEMTAFQRAQIQMARAQLQFQIRQWEQEQRQQGRLPEWAMPDWIQQAASEGLWAIREGQKAMQGLPGSEFEPWTPAYGATLDWLKETQARYGPIIEEAKARAKGQMYPGGIGGMLSPSEVGGGMGAGYGDVLPGYEHLMSSYKQPKKIPPKPDELMRQTYFTSPSTPHRRWLPMRQRA